jgi:hypothetical protein
LSLDLSGLLPSPTSLAVGASEFGVCGPPSPTLLKETVSVLRVVGSSVQREGFAAHIADGSSQPAMALIAQVGCDRGVGAAGSSSDMGWSQRESLIHLGPTSFAQPWPDQLTGLDDVDPLGDVPHPEWLAHDTPSVVDSGAIHVSTENGLESFQHIFVRHVDLEMDYRLRSSTEVGDGDAALSLKNTGTPGDVSFACVDHERSIA